jgi:hypothetical protein
MQFKPRVHQIVDTVMATNPHMSLNSAVELLTRTMRDPMKAKVCVIRLSIAADRIDQELEACTSTAAKTELAKSYPELLRAGIKFITFNRPPQDHVAMVNHLIMCRCDFQVSQTGMRRLHKPTRDRIDGRVGVNVFVCLFDVVATICNCLILALADLTQHKFRTGNIVTGEQRWPQGPEDLFPYGPKDSVVGLEYWVTTKRSFGCIIFKLAGCLALFHVPFAQEVFQSPEFTFALALPVEHLEEAVKFYEEGDSSPLARTHCFTYPVMTIFEFFDNLLHCDAHQFNRMTVARRHWISPVLARLTIILSQLPLNWSKTRSLVQHLTVYANAEVDPVTGFPLITIDRELLTEHSDLLEDAFNTMVDARKMGCWNITCSSASEVIHSRLCSQCNLIRFCGEKVRAFFLLLCHSLNVKKIIFSAKRRLGNVLHFPTSLFAQILTLSKSRLVLRIGLYCGLPTSHMHNFKRYAELKQWTPKT